MKITLHIREECGWPILTVDQPQLESGDRGVRLINFTNERAKELAAPCAKQRELTKQAKAGKMHRHPSTFFDLWREALTAQP